MTRDEHARVSDLMGRLSPEVLETLAKRDSSAAIRKHAKDALVDRILRDHGVALPAGRPGSSYGSRAPGQASGSH